MGAKHAWVRSIGRGAVAAIAAVGLAQGCSPEALAPPEDLAPPEAAGMVASSEAALELVEQLRAQFKERVASGDDPGEPEGEPALGLAATPGFVLEEGRLVPKLHRDRALDGVRRARVALPLRAHEPFELRDEPSGMQVHVATQGLRDVQAEVAGGYVVYRGAHEAGGHVIHRPLEDGTEDFVTFESKPAREEIRYTVSLGDDVAGLRLVDNVLEFVDAGGTPRLRVNRPSVVTETGRRLDAKTSVAGCVVDTNPDAPWGRPPTAAGQRRCEVQVDWSSAGAEYPLIVDPGWVGTGNMTTARTNHMAFLLSTGNVLVFGGSQTAASKSAELYNPAGAGTWAATGALQYAQTCAAELTDGRVVAAGGLETNAEVYNAGAWSAAGATTAVRSNCGLGRLGDGRLMIVNPGSALTTEIYNPATNGWSAGPSFSQTSGSTKPCVASHGSGMLVVNTGSSYCTSSTCSNFQTGTLVRPPCLRLASGDVLSLGLSSGDPEPPAAFRYTGSWVNAGAPLLQHQALAQLGDGRVLAIGPLEVERWTSTSTWRSVHPLPSSRTGLTATTLGNGNVLVAGGGTNTAVLFTGGDGTGGVCNQTFNCSTGTCVDGYCCNSTCTASCYSCSSARTNQPNGTCAPTLGGLDSKGLCQNQQATCGTKTTCSGAGACATYTAGEVCVASSCTTNASGNRVFQPASQCNSSSTCVAPSPITCATGYTCSTTGCHSSCTTNTQCHTTHYCVAPNCVAKKPNGDTCTAAGQCQSGFCVEGVCCDSACSATSSSCLQANTGTANGACSPIMNGIPCTSGTQCGSGNCVDGVCCNTACAQTSACIASKTGLPNGQCGPRLTGTACTAATQCASGFCVDGFCCDTLCNTPCRACSAAKKGSGSDGACGNIVSGTDPDNECSPQGAGFCQTTGNCDGAGACGTKEGTVCASSSCSGSSTMVNPSTCTSTGTCASNGTTSCNPYVCSSGACQSSCTNNSQCVAPSVCTGGSCGSCKNDGNSCGAGNECCSGNCVDGVCCNSPCTGACVSCKSTENASGNHGQCGPVIAGTDPGDKCPASGTACGANGLCNGSGACNGNAPSGTTCGATTCASQNQVSGQVCDGSGSCQSSPGQICANGYKCASGACLTSCGTNSDCVSGYFCKTGSCTPQYGQGATCTGNDNCSSGFCVDGYCCDGACAGGCQSCAGVNTVSGINGKCDPVKDGTDPRDACAASTTNPCGADGMCGAGAQCRQYQASGTVCGGNVCVGTGSVASQVCNGTGTCLASSQTTNCSPYKCTSGSCLTGCTTSNDCAGGFFCSVGACIPLLQNGGVCSVASQCASGFCVDGVCCNNSCTGPCRSCAGVNTVGGVDGLCDFVNPGIDPRDACPKDNANPCGADGMCGSAGVCRASAASGTSCGSTVCAGEASVAGQLCDGAGTCASAQSTPCPGGLKCASGSCLTACSTHSDCAGNLYCKGQACVAKESAGTTCSEAAQCASGQCVDGVCCDTACTGSCVSCAGNNTVGGVDGKCDTVKAGTDPRNACPASAGDLCGADGMCGANGECRPFAIVGTQCGADECSGASAVTKSCDGFGACKSTPAACLPYACEPATGACKATCVSQSDCSTGANCNTATGQCAITGATCKDPYTVIEPNSVETSCAPYLCVAGACQSSCDQESDCAPGHTCANSKCVSSGTGGTGAGGTSAGGTSAGGTSAGGTGATGSGGEGAVDGGAGTSGGGASEDDGGCGCRAVGRDAQRGGGLVLLMLAGLIAAGRRRSARSAQGAR